MFFFVNFQIFLVKKINIGYIKYIYWEKIFFKWSIQKKIKKTFFIKKNI